MQNFPWQPIFSIERSLRPEITIYGILVVVEGGGQDRPQVIYERGNTSFPMWTRSLLKSWQLLSHLDVITRACPELGDDHIALMMSSHNAEPIHMELLEEIIELTGLDRDWLQCPITYPYTEASARRLKEKGLPPSRLYHNCSAKHFSYLLSRQAQGLDPLTYRDFENPDFQRLKKILGFLLGRDPETFDATTDGCQLPNHALSAYEIASLYQILASGSLPESGDQSIDSALLQVPRVFDLMRRYPHLIGGADRLDTSIMAGRIETKLPLQIAAKDGADGMLALAIAPNQRFKNGLGILIKSSSGYETKYMELIARELFFQLGLTAEHAVLPDQLPGCRTDHLQVRFHFDIGAPVLRARI